MDLGAWMPRRYTLGKREGQKEATRQRILNAASALYQEHGVSQTTIQDVARRADVAPGTVLNHFASAEALARAVVDGVVGSLRLPSEAMFDGLAPGPERIAQLCHELFAFYERGDAWYRVYAREQGSVTAWADAEATFYAAHDRLIRGALGPLAQDEPTLAMVSTLLGGEVFAMLRNRGLSTPEIAALVNDVLSPWLERKVAVR
jgi:AcrR family transcriptional regulator